MNETEEIKQFLFTQFFDTAKGQSAYGSYLFARSWEEARLLCEKIGARLDGVMEGGASHTKNTARRLKPVNRTMRRLMIFGRMRSRNRKKYK